MAGPRSFDRNKHYQWNDQRNRPNISTNWWRCSRRGLLPAVRALVDFLAERFALLDED
jgi:hypothetical protein